jgi:hypothetical protein
LKRYSFDTSAFIEPWTRHYPIDLVESLWDRLDSMGKKGLVTALTPVFWEIQEKHDGLYGWLSERKHLICEPIEEVQHIVRDILRTHRRLVSMAKNRSGADPWVIAHAKHIGGAVVTYETWDPRRKNIKIPEVCHDLNVECLTFVDFLRNAGIRLRAVKV